MGTKNVSDPKCGTLRDKFIWTLVKKLKYIYLATYVNNMFNAVAIIITHS